MNPNHSTRSRFAYFISLARRFRLLIVLVAALPLGLFIHSCWLTMKSDWVLLNADSVVVQVRRNLDPERRNLEVDAADSNGWKYDYYKLTGTEKAEFVAQFRQRTFALFRRTYAGIYPFYVHTLDANGRCNARILVQATAGRPEQWEAIYDAAVKGERVDEAATVRQTGVVEHLVHQIKR